MSSLIVAIHILVCIFLILIVLLQTGKGAEIGATFGGSSQTVFGPRGAGTLLSKLTVIAAVIFMVTSISLSYLKGRPDSTRFMEKEVAPAGPVETAPAPTAPPLPDTAPGTPAPPAQAPIPQSSPEGK